MATSSKKNQIKDEPIYHGLMLQDVISSEYLLENGRRIPILNGVSIEIDKTEILGISGYTRLELIVLIEILGNMRAYYKGRARLSKYGVLRKKRRIVEEIFYIDSANMLQGQMLVLEQIMFAMVKKKTDVLQMQKRIMDLLVRLCMKKFMLQKIDNLSYNERIVIAILIGILSKSQIVIVNIVDNEFSDSEIQLLKSVADFAKECGKGLVVATMEPKMIGVAFDNVAYVIDGKIDCHEPVEYFCQRLDKVICVIKGNDYDSMKELLEESIQGIECYQSNGVLVVNGDGINKVKVGKIYELFDLYDIDYDFIKINKGRVLNSFEELVRRRDIQ